MTIDWTQAPAWVRWHACDEDGYHGYYEFKPTQGSRAWLPKRGTRLEESIYEIPAGQDWRQSLVEKTKEETR